MGMQVLAVVGIAVPPQRIPRQTGGTRKARWVSGVAGLVTRQMAASVTLRL